MRIGLDFDNTLAGYDHVFAHIAKRLGFIPTEFLGDKQAVKSLLQSDVCEGEENWMRLQGQVYGRFMGAAVLLPGAAEFIAQCQKKGHEIFIISHKTQYGHFDEAKIDLREAAVKWMNKQGFFDEKKLGLKKENVFFHSTRDEKIDQIRSLDIDVFVDDLEVVLNHPKFPQKTKKYLYAPNQKQGIAHWNELQSKLFGQNNLETPTEIAKSLLGGTEIEIQKVAKSGNNQLFKIITLQGKFALKFYLDHPLDDRDRLKAECEALLLFEEFGEQQVPKLVKYDAKRQAALFSWEDGEGISNRSQSDLDQLFSFVERLADYSERPINKTIFLASEACLCAFDLIQQVDQRLQRLADVACLNTGLEKLLKRKFFPARKLAEKKLLNAYAEIGLDVNAHVEKRILSPSDFGFHNALRREENDLCFFDFEYFGWDDPVKLSIDTIIHPAYSLDENERASLKGEFVTLFSKQDDGFLARFDAQFPLYVLRWCAIILNPFLPEKWHRHEFAGEQDCTLFCQERLARADRFFDEHWIN